MNDTASPMWSPSINDARATQLYAFKLHLEKKMGRKLFPDYDALWRWSVDNLAEFWSELWDFCDVLGDKGDVAIENSGKMPGARFFPHGKINFAENLLRRRDNGTAIVFRGEDKVERRLTFKELYDAVSQLRQVLVDAGVGQGDRIAGYVANMPEAVIGHLATASLGAIWSSASPDFGVQGVIDRFGQIEPKVLIAVDGYFYSGKTIDCLAKLREIQPQLPGLQKTIVIGYTSPSPDLTGLANAQRYSDAIAPYKPETIRFERFDFNQPLLIMFSSGTTGVPKCIVHGAGGVLLTLIKEHKLQCDVRRDDKVFYFTTCGWMMWNWLIVGLAAEATLLLFDGSPFYPTPAALFDYADAEGMTLFGTSAKYIDALHKAGTKPIETHKLTTVRTMTSTGSPLVHESFDYVYGSIKKDVHLASISGGTDIVSCFVIGNPISPVYRGEIQGAGLGYAMDAYSDEGNPIPPGAGQGELVCTRPFPSMPVMFWNDPDGERYKAAYFERFPNIWCHGDWVERTAHKGWIIHGRSDATLNPGGVRIGTAEIYRQVEQVEDVLESIAVGQDWQGDVRIILFVRLRDGVELDDTLVKKIKDRIRSGASPRHVPAKIIKVADIPRTKSGKITELAVRDVITGRKVKNVEALANPQALDLYKDLPDLRSS